jgi:hypothetical protein
MGRSKHPIEGGERWVRLRGHAAARSLRSVLHRCLGIRWNAEADALGSFLCGLLDVVQSGLVQSE